MTQSTTEDGDWFYHHRMGWVGLEEIDWPYTAEENRLFQVIRPEARYWSHARTHLRFRRDGEWLEPSSLSELSGLIDLKSAVEDDDAAQMIHHIVMNSGLPELGGYGVEGRLSTIARKRLREHEPELLVTDICQSLPNGGWLVTASTWQLIEGPADKSDLLKFANAYLEITSDGLLLERRDLPFDKTMEELDFPVWFF